MSAPLQLAGAVQQNKTTVPRVISAPDLQKVFPDLVDPATATDYQERHFAFALLAAFSDGTSRAHWKRAVAAGLAHYSITFDIYDSAADAISSAEAGRPLVTYLHERKYGKFFKRNDLGALPAVFGMVIGVNHPERLSMLADKMRLHDLMSELELSQFQPERYGVAGAVFPCIVKPRQASNAQGAALCSNSAELEQAVFAAQRLGHRICDASEHYIILQLIESTTDCNTDFLACKGRLLACVTWTKATNPKGGVFWRQSIPADFIETDPRVIGILEKVLEHTGYDGFGNIDYMYQDDTPKVFDFNPRPSGTLLRFGLPVLAIWLKKYSPEFDTRCV